MAVSGQKYGIFRAITYKHKTGEQVGAVAYYFHAHRIAGTITARNAVLNSLNFQSPFLGPH